MDLERLTKHQVVLLTLLVSFVTSIATGIVTVSLMEQAPAGVTRTINQIVEHTVERVVPTSQGASVATTEKTIVVKDDDLTAQSIAAIQKALVRIVPRGRDNFIARGVVVSQNGLTLTDSTSLAPYRTNRFDAILPNGERVVAVLNAGSGPIASLTLGLGTSSGIEPAKIGDAQNLKVGQSVIRVNDSIGIGIVAAAPSSPAKDGTATLQTTVDASTPGSVLVTLFGEVVGLTTGSSLSMGSTYYTAPSVSPAAP